MKRSLWARAALLAAIALLAVLMLAGTLFALYLGLMGAAGVYLSFDGGRLNAGLLALCASGLAAVGLASVCGYRMLFFATHVCRLWLREAAPWAKTALWLKRIAKSGAVCAAGLLAVTAVWGAIEREATMAIMTLGFAGGYLLAAGAARLGVGACRRHMDGKNE